MDTQPNGTEGNTSQGGLPQAETTPPAASQPPLDPLRRVLIPIEHRTQTGTVVFKTTDRRMYARQDEGMPMHRVDRKVRGKAARAEDRRQRRALRERKERTMSKQGDPREDRHPEDSQTDSSPDKGEARPAPGGAGTGTKDDPGKEPAAQPKDGDRE